MIRKFFVYLLANLNNTGVVPILPISRRCKMIRKVSVSLMASLNKYGVVPTLPMFPKIWFFRHLALAVFWMAIISTFAFAEWSANPIPLTTAPGHQGLPAIISDGRGGSFVAWNDYESRNISVQHIDSVGKNLWAENDRTVSTGRVKFSSNISMINDGSMALL